MRNKVTQKIVPAMLVLFFPMMVSCSSLFGGGVSNDPAVRAQQQRVQALEAELEEAERLTDEAEQREKAARDRLKAAEHELKALESRAKRRGY